MSQTPTSPLSLTTALAVSLGVPFLVNFVVLMSTGTTGKFLWLFQQAAPLLIVAWPLTLPLVIWLHFARKDAKNRDQLNDLRLLWLVPLIVIPITMLTWGAVFAHPRGRGFMRWHLAPLHWAFYSTVALSIAAVLFNKGRRAFVASLSMLLILFSFSCSFTAGSSVTGDWL